MFLEARNIRILDKKRLIENVISDKDRKARMIALRILEVALRSADPRIAVKNHVNKIDGTLKVDNLKFDLKNFRRIYVVGGGKASGAMGEALEEILGNSITEGFINVLQGTKSNFKTGKIILNEASHPIPNARGVKGAIKIIQLVRKAKERDLVVCLISGGGSALMPLPTYPINLSEKQALSNDLLKCGATIHEINSVRKHLSDMKGGQLAKAAYPATLISLILSDVVGDSLDTIASGPTAPDQTTFLDAISVLKQYNLWKKPAFENVRKRLKNGFRGNIPETPKPDAEIFSKTYNVVIGNNRSVALTARKEAEDMGFNTLLLSSMIEGEARHVGSVYAGIMKEVHFSDNPIPKPAVLIAGGETTVTVTGNGKGGRNQELVLSASLRIKNLKGVAILSIDTDGIDGSTDAAGAIADSQTTNLALEKGFDPTSFLANNDSYGFFSRIGDLIYTGSTWTNLNDLTVMVIT
jgi:glycerate 2-kinase